MGNAKCSFIFPSILLQGSSLLLSVYMACAFLACSKAGDPSQEAGQAPDPAARVEMIKKQRDKIAQSAREQVDREIGSKIPRGRPFIVVDGKKLCYLDREKLRSLPQVEFEGKRESAVAVTLIDLLNEVGIETAETVVFSNFVEQNLLSVSWRDIEDQRDAFVFVLNRPNISKLRYKEPGNDESLLKTVRVKKIAVSTS